MGVCGVNDRRKSLLAGECYFHELNDWQISWESDGNYRHWCHQAKEGFKKNLLVVMFNPGSLSHDGANLRKDTTLRILREVCEPAKLNPFIVNLFDFANPSANMLFANWEKRDGTSLIFNKLETIKFSAYISAYGDYENSCEYDTEIKNRIALVKSNLLGIREIILPLNKSGTPKHPMTWQRQKLKSEISQLLIERIE